MDQPIYATWCISNNLGDALTPWLIEKITGRMPLYVPYEVTFPKYMVSGSILNHAVQYTTVWGAGFAKADDTVLHTVDVRVVRGPITAVRIRQQAGIPVKVVGDPALLMPRFYNPDKREIYKVGICPHYLHQPETAAWIGERADVKLLNVFDGPERFVDDLCSCGAVYSSSLHGLIVADAYGIPSQWIDGTAQLGGDGTKFHDHLIIRDYLSREDGRDKLLSYIIGSNKLELNKSITRLHLQQLPKDIEALHDAIAANKPPDFAPLCDALWEACPFKPEEKGEPKQ